ncbi:MAG: hypothetical protein ACE5RJ_03385 [Nitrosopumilaceae archaeon]
MNKKQTSKFSIIAIIAVTSFAIFQITEITAEESSEKKYTFANDVEISGVFSFEGNEPSLIQFQVFTQESGFDRVSERATFKLVKELNDKSPLLYKAADMVWKYSNVPGMDYATEFDVSILLARGGEIIRQFDYTECIISDYAVETLFDKEEGWTTSKGFAVIDEFEVLCEGYAPVNPIYEKTNGYTLKKADTLSSLDLIAEQKARLGQ